MSIESKTEFLLLFRGTNWHRSLSPEQIQNVMDQWKRWYEGLASQGTVKVGQPLTNEGRTVSGKGGRTVADGPFAESKEAIAGYFLIEADNLDEAVAIAQACPALEYGTVVEVRQIAPECPVQQHMAKQQAEVELAHA